MTRFALAVLTILTGLAAEASAGDAACDTEAVRERSIAWVKSWDFGGDAGPFDFEAKLARFYPDGRGEVVCHDGNDPGRHVVYTAAEHVAIFAAIFKEQKIIRVRNQVDRINRVECGGDLAFCSFIATATFETADGTSDQAPILYSLLWKRSGDRWLIASEHGTPVNPTNIAAGPWPMNPELTSDGGSSE